MVKYFVTGGTGFIGSHLVSRLVDRGDDVVVLARHPAAATFPESVDVVQGDITDGAGLTDTMAGCDRVFHLAGWYEVGDPDRAVATRVNVEGTRNILEAMADLGIEKGVYTSTLAVFSDTNGTVVDESYRHNGPHLTVYDETKWRAHFEVAEPMMESGLPLVIAQPGAVYGPGDRGPMWRLWRAYLERNLPVIPRRTGVCWGHVEDTVDGLILAMDRGTPEETYIIAGEPKSFVEVFDLAEELTGIDAPRAVPPALFRALARAVSPIERLIPFPPEYRSESLRILGGVTYYGDNTKAVRELGLSHRPLVDGLRETLDAEQHVLESAEDR